VFAEGLDDGWAAFSVETSSYEWLTGDAKRGRFLALLGALEAIEADVQILRVGRSWDVDQYARELDGELGAGDGGACTGVRVQARNRYVGEHVRRLRDVGLAQPAVFLMVSLREPERDVAAYVSSIAERHPRQLWRTFRRALTMRDARVLSVAQLEAARVRADQAHARLADFLRVRRRRGADVRAAGKPSVWRRSVTERALPAQRAGLEDCASQDPRRRPNRAGRGRWRAGRVRPGLRAHATGA